MKCDLHRTDFYIIPLSSDYIVEILYNGHIQIIRLRHTYVQLCENNEFMLDEHHAQRVAIWTGRF